MLSTDNTTNMQFNKPIPILRIFDEAKAREFYVDYLGFNIDWEHRFRKNTPLYCQLSKDECVIHLSEHHGDGTPGTKVRIECNDLQSYLKLLKSKNYKYLNPGIDEPPWGTLETSLADPFGNSLIFYQQKEIKH
jgi:uncharacterized glyoxalase superfamily protein PhnB